jgi:hypothetical protein
VANTSYLNLYLILLTCLEGAVQCCGKTQNDKVLRVQLKTDFFVWSAPFLSFMFCVLFSVKQGGSAYSVSNM